MGVLGKSSRLIFCEGGDQSLDRRLVNRLLDGRADWTVIPGGSKSGLARFAEGYLSHVRSRSWIVLQDRDFDQWPSELPTLEQAESGKLVRLHRSEVESYLLDPALIHRYWVEGSAGPRAEFRHPRPPDEIRIMLRHAAESLAPYQAIRWGLAAARGQQGRRISSTWTRGNGDLPSPEALSWEACLESARGQISAMPSSSSLLDTLEAEASRVHARFLEEDFYSSERYLVWFNAKDIQKQVQRERPELFSLKAYFDWAVDQLDWSTHPDLRELAGLLTGDPP